MNDTEKIGFDSEELAREELFRIVNTNYNPVPKRNVKPSRYYYSEITQKWHLTSHPTVIVYPKK